MGMIDMIIIMILVVVVAIVTISVLISYMKCHKLRIRDPLTRGHYIEDYLMIEYQDQDTREYRWKSVWWQKKYDIEKPPAEALDVGKKGKKYAEAYRVSEGQHCWINDKGLAIECIEKEGTKEWHIVDILPNGKTQIIDRFRPLTVTQRQEIINQHKKAIEISKQKGLTTEKIISIVQFSVLAIIIIMALIFGKDLYEGHNKSQSHITANLKIQEQISKNLAVLSQNLGVNSSGKEFTISQVPQSTTGGLIISTEEKQPIE